MGNVLAPFKKFLSNKNTITILGVLLGVVVLYLGYQWRVNQAISPTTTFYATRTLVQGEKINAEDIGKTQISKTILDSMTNIVNDESNIVDQLVSFDCKIPQNSYFFKECLISEDEMPDSIFSNIPDGYTIFSLSVDNHSTYANSIFPDDSIDLYMATKSTDEDSKIIYGKFIKSIQVLAVKDSKGNNVFRDRENVGEPAELLFSVPEDLYLLLSKAIYVGSIDIVPVPRNASYSTNREETEVESEFLRNYIIEKTVQIPDEEVGNVTKTTTEEATNTEE
jgi:Flp pilus assembly protein CpaB